MACQYLTALADPGFRAKFGYEVPRLTVRAAAINCGASLLIPPEAIALGPNAISPQKFSGDVSICSVTENHMTGWLAPPAVYTDSEP